jgi:hypothetical protein
VGLEGRLVACGGEPVALNRPLDRTSLWLIGFPTHRDPREHADGVMLMGTPAVGDADEVMFTGTPACRDADEVMLMGTPALGDADEVITRHSGSGRQRAVISPPGATPLETRHGWSPRNRRSFRRSRLRRDGATACRTPQKEGQAARIASCDRRVHARPMIDDLISRDRDREARRGEAEALPPSCQLILAKRSP